MNKLTSTQFSLLTGLLFLLTLSFYLLTMQPSLSWGDGIRLQREAITAESYIFAEMVEVTFAYDPFPFARLGVAAWDHPLYVVLGYSLTQLLTDWPTLWLVNSLSAIFGAATIILFFQIVYRHTHQFYAALLSSGALALSHTFWWHSTTPEVYTLFTFLLLLAVDAYDRYEQNGRYQTLLWATFGVGLGLSNHLLAGLLLPAFLLYHLFKHLHARHVVKRPDRLTIMGCVKLVRSALQAWPQWLGLGVAFLAGFSIYLIQLFRLLRTFSLVEVMGAAAGVTFLRGSLALTPALLLESGLTYMLFWFYQFGLLGLLGIYGWWYGRQIWPNFVAKIGALFLVYLAFGLVYQVSDQFAFFMAAHLFWAMAMGVGLACWQIKLTTQWRPMVLATTAVLIIAMPLFYQVAPDTLRRLDIDDATFGIPVVGVDVRDGLDFYLNPNRRGDRDAEQFGQQTLATLPPYSLVLAHWYPDTDVYFVLRYFITVEEMRPDVEVLGWPTADPFNFDVADVLEVVETAVSTRPIYLASLDDQFYPIAQLRETYCLLPDYDTNLYRLYPAGHGPDC